MQHPCVPISFLRACNGPLPGRSCPQISLLRHCMHGMLRLLGAIWRSVLGAPGSSPCPDTHILSRFDLVLQLAC